MQWYRLPWQADTSAKSCRLPQQSATFCWHTSLPLFPNASACHILLYVSASYSNLPRQPDTFHSCVSKPQQPGKYACHSSMPLLADVSLCHGRMPHFIWHLNLPFLVVMSACHGSLLCQPAKWACQSNLPLFTVTSAYHRILPFLAACHVVSLQQQPAMHFSLTQQPVTFYWLCQPAMARCQFSMIWVSLRLFADESGCHFLLMRQPATFFLMHQPMTHTPAMTICHFLPHIMHQPGMAACQSSLLSKPATAACYFLLSLQAMAC